MASKNYPWLKRADRGTFADPSVCYMGPNARTVIDREKLDRLKAQIKGQGVLEPLIVRRRPTTIPLDGGKISYLQVWDGQRRLLAVRELINEGESIEWIPVSIQTKSDAEMMVLAAQTVTGKEPLDPIDEANMVAMLINYGLETTEIGDRLGMSAPWVNRRRGLQTLEPPGRDALRADKITIGRAEELAKLTAEEQAEELAKLLEGTPSSSSSSKGKGKGSRPQGVQHKRPGKRAIRKMLPQLSARFDAQPDIWGPSSVETILNWVAGDISEDELRESLGLEDADVKPPVDDRQTGIPGTDDDGLRTITDAEFIQAEMDHRQECVKKGEDPGPLTDEFLKAQTRQQIADLEAGTPDDNRTPEQRENLERVQTALGVPPSKPETPEAKA